MGNGTDPAAETEAAPIADASIAPPAGPKLVADRYEILGLLGAGAMGTVYRARDRELDEIVALKVLKRELAAAPGMIARFRREVKLARRVTHKNVARTFDIGDHAGERFLTMEFIEGEMLGARLARLGRLGVAEAFAIGADVCAGLAAAHAAGVLHRDLKPENVIVDKSGRAIITDFGIARALAEVEAARTGGGIVGTPAYMAPEQVEGARELDGRADLYALGAMLFELLTGAMPWTGDSIIAIAAARLLRPPPDPRTLARDISDEAAELVGELMARRREERIASAEDARARLAAIATTIGPSAEEAPQGRRVVARAARSAQRTVAVLPLLIDTAEDEYLRAIGEDLVDALTTVPDLRVRTAPATPEHTTRSRDAREIGRALGVDVVVDGSVRRAGDVLRVAVRLVTVADGFQLWARRWDRRVEQVLAVADDAAADIARTLTAARAPRAGAAQPNDPRAQDLYLRARHAMNRSWWWEHADEVLDLLSRACELAPDDARIRGAYGIGLARAYANDVCEHATAKRAREAAEHALRLQPDQPEALTAIGLLHLGDGEGAAAMTQMMRALRVAPGAIDALDAVGRLLAEIGRTEEGVELLKRVHSREQVHRAGFFAHARVLALAGDFESALEMMGELPRTGRDLMPHLVGRARLILWSGDASRARAMLDELPQLNLPDSILVQPVVQTLSVALHRTMTDDVKRQMSRSIPFDGQRTARRSCFNAQIRAELECAVGAFDDAFVALRAADAAGLIDVEWLSRCPLLAPLRTRPELDPIHANVQARARRISDAYDES
ncbi:MAG TPA: protein kinase [Labilithrix sp.]